MGFEDLLEVVGDYAACAVAAADAFGFAPAVDADKVGGDAGAVAADVLTGGRTSGHESVGAVERA